MIDAELLLRDWLAMEFPTNRVVTELPANLQDVVPLMQVGRVGGFNHRPGLDRMSADVVCFALAVGDGRNGVRKQAEVVRDVLLAGLPGYVHNGATVTGVATMAAPGFRPYDNPAVRCYGATYAVYVKATP